MGKEIYIVLGLTIVVLSTITFLIQLSRKRYFETFFNFLKTIALGTLFYGMYDESRFLMLISITSLVPISLILAIYSYWEYRKNKKNTVYEGVSSRNDELM